MACYEILAYLVEHPEARDTLEGIVELLLKRNIKFQTTQVKEPLVELVDKGSVFERKRMDSKIQCSINHNKCNEILGLLNQNNS